MTTLAEAFRRGSGHKTEWGGQTVHSLVRLPVQDRTRINLTRLATSDTRAQALKISLDRGELRANGVLAPTIAIWSHTAPDSCTIDVVGKRARSIDIWNSWSLDGVDSAWLGQAGMLLESDGPRHVLRCSDGLGEPSFTDLVVRVEIERRD